MNQLDVVSEARRYVGVPYRHMGTTLAGVDCLGLVWRVGYDLGLISMELPYYSGEPVSNALADGLNSEMVKVPDIDAQPGDVFLFKFARFSQHVGIYAGRNIIHAYQQINGCREHIFDGRWQRLRMATYRFREFA